MQRVSGYEEVDDLDGGDGGGAPVDGGKQAVEDGIAGDGQGRVDVVRGLIEVEGAAEGGAADCWIGGGVFFGFGVGTGVGKVTGNVRDRASDGDARSAAALFGVVGASEVADAFDGRLLFLGKSGVLRGTAVAAGDSALVTTLGLRASRETEGVAALGTDIDSVADILLVATGECARPKHGVITDSHARETDHAISNHGAISDLDRLGT